MIFGTWSRLEVDILGRILEFIAHWLEGSKSPFAGESDGKRKVI